LFNITEEVDMKVGIVGCGNIATLHVPNILRHKNIEVVSIADVHRQTAEELASQFGLKNIYSDFEAMLNEQKPDVVHILTPPATHAPLAIRAMESGCHVLVEKPMALTLEEADAMIISAKKNAVKLCVDHTFLFDPNMIKAQRLVQKGVVGRIVHVEAFYSFDMRRLDGLAASTGFQANWLLHLIGGPLLDLVPHPLSILLHFVKNPVKVWAVHQSNGLLPESLPDELRVLIDGGNVTGSLAISLGTRPDCLSVNIYGTEMSIHLNMSNMTLITRKNRRIPKKISRSLDSIEQAVQLLSCTFFNALGVVTGRIQPPGDVGPVITKFYESIENDSEVPITGEDGRGVVQVINEIWHKAA
jgi:predicted dehydrogenase